MPVVSTNPWLYIPKPVSQPVLRVVCLPYAAGGASHYRPWAFLLPQGVELCGIQLPGHETRIRERLETDSTPIVTTLATALEPLLDQPIALFGHSMGALLAFELTREFRRRGHKPPVHLFVSGRQAPHLSSGYEAIWNRPEPEFLRAVIDRYNGIPKAVLDDPEMMRLFMPILRADVAIVENYVCAVEEPLAMPITVFSGLDDPSVNFAGLAAWREFTTSGFRLEMQPGGHFYLQQNREALVASIVCDLRRRLGSLLSM